MNISTALKVDATCESNLAFLEQAEADDKWDPPSLFTRRSAPTSWTMAERHMRLFGSAGKAW